MLPANDPDEPYRLQDQPGFLLRRAFQRHAAIFQEVMASVNATSVQYLALSVVESRSACSVSEIVRLTGIDAATIRGVIERLEYKGWVEVQHDPDDARKLLIQLTLAGRSLLDCIEPLVAAVSGRTLERLNSEERIALHYLIEKMIAPERL